MRFVGKSERLSDLITAKRFDGKELDVTSLEANKIVLKIKKR